MVVRVSSILWNSHIRICQILLYRVEYRSAHDVRSFLQHPQLYLQFFRRISSSKTNNYVIGSDFIVRSTNPDLKALLGITLPELLWSNMPSKENAPAFESSCTGRVWTHFDIYKNTLGFASALIQAGLKYGDCVIILLPNMPEFPISLLGVLHAGGIASTANPAYTTDEIERQILISGSKYVITIPTFLSIVKGLKRKCSSLKSIIVVGEPHEDCHTFYEMLKCNPLGMNFLKGSNIDTESTVAVLPFSSGTTGLPKGVELTHANLCTNILQYNQPDVSGINSLQDGLEGDRMIGVLPFFHIFGLTGNVLSGHFMGAHILTIAKFQPADFVTTIRKFKPTILTIAPPILQFLANSPEVFAKDFESVKSIQVGAAPTGLSLINKVLEKAGKYIFFQEMYGLTETSPAVIIMNPSKKNTKTGSCGTLVGGTFARVVDLNSGANLRPKQEGELCLRGPQIMRGYINDVEATNHCVDKDKWFHTGDIAYYDEDGCFYIVDRVKELIKVKGFQVAPAELENLLRKIPGILDVAVIGVPDERYGELPRAYIVRRASSLNTELEIHAFLDGKIAKYKELKGGIEFVDTIPKSPAGKILRRQLRSDYIKKHDK